jgi:hypothetical protein
MDRSKLLVIVALASAGVVASHQSVLNRTVVVADIEAISAGDSSSPPSCTAGWDCLTLKHRDRRAQKYSACV